MSSRYRDLRIAIAAFLRSKHPRVYFQQADNKAAFPYLVFDLPNTIDTGESPEVYVLDVDGWDDSPDTGALEDLMALVDGDGDPTNPSGLQRHVFILPAGSRAAVYRDSVLAPPPPADEPRLRRRRITYEVRVY